MTLAQMNLSASLMILVIALVRALALHRLPKKVFVLLWGVVAARLLLPVRVASPLSLFNLLPAAHSGTAPVSAAGLVPVSAALPHTTIRWPLLIWAVGAALCGGALLCAWLKSRRVFAASLPACQQSVLAWRQAHPLRRAYQLRVSDQITAPLTYGLLRPVILLPKTDLWKDDAQLALALTHEWMHIRHWDALKKGVLGLLLVLYWYNPFVWALYLLANRDIELACDEAALRRLGIGQKSRYALALLQMEETDAGGLSLHSHFSRSALEERIGAILRHRAGSFWSAIASAALVVYLCCLLGTSAQAAGTAAPKISVGSPTQLQSFEDAVIDWTKFDVVYNPFTERVYYKDQPVRFFVDDRSDTPGRFYGTVMDMSDGEHYLVTRRGPDGTLLGIDEITPAQAAKLATWR